MSSFSKWEEVKARRGPYMGEGDKSKYVFSPFTEEQQLWLNRYQNADLFHPFTCGHCGKKLVAKKYWVCSDEDNCCYEQHWAHAFMAEYHEHLHGAVDG